MFHRPHQRAGSFLFLIGAICIVAIARAQAAPPAVPDLSIDISEEAARDEPPSTDDDDRPAEAPSAADRETAPVPEFEQEQQPLGGAPDASPAASDAPSSGSGGSWILQTLTALAIVIALIYLLRAVLMRLSGTRAGVGANRLVEVLARATIGHKTQVVFLKIHQRVIVACQTPAGMDTLTVMDDPEEVAWLLGEVEAAKPMSISQSFRHVMQRFDKDYASTEETGTDTSEQYVDRTRDELSGLMSRIRHLKDRGER